MCIFVVIAVLYWLFDVNFLIRTIFVSVTSYLNKIFRPKLLSDTGIQRGICLTSDLDLFLHMNNARYLRECDLARIKFWIENNGFQAIKKLGGALIAGAQNVRYRKPINLFTTYSINTKLVYWDDTSFYLEQSFVRSKDGFVCCVNIIKQTVLGTTPDKVVEKLPGNIKKPEPMPEVLHWLEAIKSSSERLRR